MPSAGSLTRRITICAQSTTRDSYGQPVEDWTPVLLTWAAIQSATGKQLYAVSGFVSQMSHVITIRYTKTLITPNMHVRYGSRSFVIQAVTNPDEANAEFQLLCLEIV